MNASDSAKTDAGTIDKNTSPSAETLELLSPPQLAQILKQGAVTDPDLAELVYEVATQVVIEYGHQLQLFLVIPT
jgi:hypothetical protein